MPPPTKKTQTSSRPEARKKATKSRRNSPAAPEAGSESPVKRFRVKLERHGHGEAAFFRVPFDVQKVFGTRARVAVKGAINGFPFRSSVFPEGDGTHYMVVNREVREGAGVKGGDTVSIVMGRDGEPRTVEPPADFLRALRANEAAREAWERLSYTHRKEHARAVEEAKRPETRARRIEKSISMLAAGKKEFY
ncbi:MAG TPA: YdeI/OmpD-associated family protein [Pyrinomonadaceae bacterium]|nr:YdeI/OmpD-associated family protein [Pyrinomonadaceae bacterium]